MDTFAPFVRLGFAHVTNAGALDHVLFLVALAAAYRARDWRDALWVVSAFTVGHSATLALAVLGVVAAPQPVVEFLIPVTIVAAGVETLVAAARRPAAGAAGGRRRRYRPAVAGVFGLVHGAGFAGYLREVFGDARGGIALPLFGFNVGIELGQLVVLAAVTAALWALDRATAAAGAALGPPPAAGAVLRLRAGLVSAAAVAVAARWAAERRPW